MRKSVIGWEGFYEVSEDGRVFSLDREISRKDGAVQRFKGQELKRQRNTEGYLSVHLSRPGIRQTVRIHRMVATAFIDNPLNLPEVNHKDGVRDNPHVSNLEWVTSSGNKLHAYHVLGSITMPKTGKLSQEVADQIRAEHIPGVYGCKRLGKKYGVDPSCIRAIVNNRAYPPSPPTLNASKEGSHG